MRSRKHERSSKNRSYLRRYQGTMETTSRRYLYILIRTITYRETYFRYHKGRPGKLADVAFIDQCVWIASGNDRRKNVHKTREKMTLKIDLCKEVLYDLYITKHLNTYQIADLLKCSQGLVHNSLKREGIHTRPPGESRLGIKLSATHIQKLVAARVGKKRTDATRKLMSEKATGRKHTPETCAKISQITTGKNHPNYGKHLSEETRMKIAEGNRGSKNHLWRGGISKEKARYCDKWTYRLRESVRHTFKNTCVRCGNNHIEGKKLSVHHINYDKNSGCYGKRFNLVPLCSSCHTWTTNVRFAAYHLLANWWAIQPDISMQPFIFSTLVLKNEFNNIKYYEDD